MRNYTYAILEHNYPAFLQILFSKWNHIQFATLHSCHSPYIAEITIQSKLPKDRTYTAEETFTSSIFISKDGNLYLKGADYFAEAFEWLNKIDLPDEIQAGTN